MKYCNTCETEKDESDFHKRAASKDGLSARCKTCQKVYDKARAKDPYREMQRRIYAQTEEGRLKSNKAKAEYRKRNPEKAKAHAVLARTLRGGKMIKPEYCQGCGNKCNPHGHHEDYSKPLDVTWLCVPCHKFIHTMKGD